MQKEWQTVLTLISLLLQQSGSKLFVQTCLSEILEPIKETSPCKSDPKFAPKI